MFIFALSLALLIGVLGTSSLEAAQVQQGPVTLTLQRIGTSSFASAPMATDVTGATNELDPAMNGGDADGNGASGAGIGINRSLPGTTTGKGKPVSSKPKSNPALSTHFQGLNFHDQRFANGGNQFSVEPPDQGLCAGNGFVLETVNDVLQVYDSAGNPLLNGGQAMDLNTFYGYPPAIVRATAAFGPEITDPSCIYDQAIGRFVHIALVLDRVGTTSSLAGTNHLDIAVSNTGDPTGTWTIFKLPVQNNGTQGTPDHHCNLGFCLGDYPHIGADAFGIYLTTNEFSLFDGGFYGSQVCGIGNSALTGGAGSVVLFDTMGQGPDGAGFTVWPAQTPGNQFDTDNGGTEFFLSSDAVFSNVGASNSILLWKMLNTSSLNSVAPRQHSALRQSPLTLTPSRHGPRGHCLLCRQPKLDKPFSARADRYSEHRSDVSSCRRHAERPGCHRLHVDRRQ